MDRAADDWNTKDELMASKSSRITGNMITVLFDASTEKRGTVRLSEDATAQTFPGDVSTVALLHPGPEVMRVVLEMDFETFGE